jgi:hypothetical protein
MTKFWIALLTLPVMAGLYRYAVSYGYRGWSREKAFADAITVTITMAAIATGAVLLLGCSTDSNRAQPMMSADVEREHIKRQALEFCARWPEDVACRGPKR